MKPIWLKALVLSWMISLSFPGQAGLVTFTDRAAWQSAVGAADAITEDFDSFSTDVLYGATPVTAGFLTLSVVGGPSDNSWMIDSIPAFFSTIPDVNGTTFATTLVAGGFGGTELTFGPVRALGFDYAGATYSTVSGRLTTSQGDSVDIPASDNSARSFIGFLYPSGETFTSLTWSLAGSSGINDGFAAGIDNVTAFAPIPEPVSALLFLAGIGWLVGMRIARSRAPGQNLLLQ
jgi:hypothetical protein